MHRRCAWVLKMWTALGRRRRWFDFEVRFGEFKDTRKVEFVRGVVGSKIGNGDGVSLDKIISSTVCLCYRKRTAGGRPRNSVFLKIT